MSLSTTVEKCIDTIHETPFHVMERNRILRAAIQPLFKINTVLGIPVIRITTVRKVGGRCEREKPLTTSRITGVIGNEAGNSFQASCNHHIFEKPTEMGLALGVFDDVVRQDVKRRLIQHVA
mmetsp:Transcript_35223/g.47582  ORF Transcript_35223/g.47582 Transcript_35223/m.47582 type:complete len:122 (-) Transcript_35223:59-424(-)